MRRQPALGRVDPERCHVSIRGSRRSPLSSRAPLIAVLSMLSVVAVGCGSSNKSTTTTPATANPSVTSPTTSATQSSTSSTPSVATGGVSGTWSGQYGGAYQGTFTLTWQQSGSNLSGTIKLSAPASSLGIHGTLSGGAIRFGTVGSVAITYSGSVSGNSMSGTYQVNGSTGGSWSATKA
jgi:hypothetical protein